MHSLSIAILACHAYFSLCYISSSMTPGRLPFSCLSSFSWLPSTLDLHLQFLKLFIYLAPIFIVAANSCIAIMWIWVTLWDQRLEPSTAHSSHEPVPCTTQGNLLSLSKVLFFLEFTSIFPTFVFSSLPLLPFTKKHLALAGAGNASPLCIPGFETSEANCWF